MTAKDRDELLIRIDERQRQMQATQIEILAEQKKTNGRVTKLEEKHIAHKSAMNTSWKLIAGVAALVGFLVTLLVNIFF